MFPLHCASGPSLLPPPSLIVVSIVTEGTHPHWSQHNVCLVMFSPCLFPPVCTLSRAPSCVSDRLPEVRPFFLFCFLPGSCDRIQGSPVPRPDPGVASPATGSRGRQSRDRIQGSPVPRPDRRVACPRDLIGGSPVPATSSSPGSSSGPLSSGQLQPRLQLWAARPAASSSPGSSSGPPVQWPAPAPAPALGRPSSGQLQLWAARTAASSSTGTSSGPPVPRPAPAPAPALGRQSRGQLQPQFLDCHLGLIFYFFCVCGTGLCCVCHVVCLGLVVVSLLCL